MANEKKVKLVALRGIRLGVERIEAGTPFEATEEQAKRLKAKGVAADPPKEAKKGAE